MQKAQAAARPADAAQLHTLPAGTYLPVALYHTIKAGSTRPGTPIQAFTTQRVPVAPERFLPRGVALSGTVVASTAGPGGTVLTLRFTTLHYGGHDVPLRLGALAIANISDVSDTFAPMTITGDPSDTSPANWTTMQVGGDMVMRSGWLGPLLNDRTQTVGFADFHGVYAYPSATLPASAKTAPPVPEVSSPDALPLAVGVFSATARGLYGYDSDVVLASGSGDFTITAPRSVSVRANANLLLQVL